MAIGALCDLGYLCFLWGNGRLVKGLGGNYTAKIQHKKGEIVS